MAANRWWKIGQTFRHWVVQMRYYRIAGCIVKGGDLFYFLSMIQSVLSPSFSVWPIATFENVIETAEVLWPWALSVQRDDGSSLIRQPLPISYRLSTGSWWGECIGAPMDCGQCSWNYLRCCSFHKWAQTWATSPSFIYLNYWRLFLIQSLF